MDTIENQPVIPEFQKGKDPKNVTWKEFFDTGIEVWRYGNLICSKYYKDKEQICHQLAKKRTLIEAFKEFNDERRKQKNDPNYIYKDDSDPNNAIYEEDKQALRCIKDLQNVFDKYFVDDMKIFDKCILSCSAENPKGTGPINYFGRHTCWRRCEGDMNTRTKLIIRDMEAYFKEIKQNPNKQEIDETVTND